MSKHETFMHQALSLAKKAKGFTHPNPLVGCVIVKNNRVIAKGYHEYFGGFHAEVNALLQAKEKAKKATMYVTLEPCDHYGKTPPCTEAIIKAGIKQVVVAMKDPNPLNNGKGISRLKKSGIDVLTGVCEKKAVALNRPFIKYINKKMPYVTVKIAQSLDGKIATSTGDSKWITNEKSRLYVQRLRADSDVVLTGINTIIEDDACLLPRIRTKKNPVRVILDTHLRIPLKAKIIKTVKLSDVIIFTSSSCDPKKKVILQKKGVKIISAKTKNKRIDIKDVLKNLGQLGFLDILVEAGSEVVGSFLDEKQIDKVMFFISPKIIAGKNAVTSIGGNGVKKVSRAVSLTDIKQTSFDSDLLVEGFLN
ncbi:MAG: bifunctional diaminohydroxyphosphoribosylaminopyrimidine deaminase/5-amino-6-(5-phosphoribosylamino)uracil reductase RibD [Candidatus Omnitrophica bacterium]|nr:bifunctional diaminohydroxyphosphoribosylaminopyrimidine deaminase/5-amino-6-(5-phosphoribosylamino)uracil reductase RibD [Candidatus Omnitrophota bacterium]